MNCTILCTIVWLMFFGVLLEQHADASATDRYSSTSSSAAYKIAKHTECSCVCTNETIRTGKNTFDQFTTNVAEDNAPQETFKTTEHSTNDGTQTQPGITNAAATQSGDIAISDGSTVITNKATAEPADSGTPTGESSSTTNPGQGSVSTEPTSPCDFSYNGTCFWVIFDRDKDNKFTFFHGIKKCHDTGGVPATIRSEDHYDQTVSYLRNNNFIGFTWLGMTYNSKTGIVTSTISPSQVFVKWRPDGYPHSEIQKSHISLHVKKNASDPTQGMINEDPTFERPRVLCE